MSNFLYDQDPEKVARCCEMFLAGATLREVAKTEKIAARTAEGFKKFAYNFAKENGLWPIMCPCGKLAGHKDWCDYRAQQSPAQQSPARQAHVARNYRAKV